MVPVLPTTLRVLPKNHLYEGQSRTLFGSDTWGLAPQDTSSVVEIVRNADERLSTAAITRHLLHRFEWLAGVETLPMQVELTGLLRKYPIDRICSSYGCIIEGRSLVADTFLNTVSALQALSKSLTRN